MTFLLQFPSSGLFNTLNDEMVVNKKSRTSDCTALTSNDYNSTNNKLGSGGKTNTCFFRPLVKETQPKPRLLHMREKINYLTVYFKTSNFSLYTPLSVNTLATYIPSIQWLTPISA